jgi:hypothetical protein
MKENGFKVKGMDMVFNSGLMEQAMKDSGRIINRKEEVDLFILMGMSTMANGLVTKPMGTVYTCIQMEPSTKAFGKMISNMVWESKSGKMALNMKVTTVMAASTVSDATNGMMALCSLETGMKIKFTE